MKPSKLPVLISVFALCALTACQENEFERPPVGQNNTNNTNNPVPTGLGFGETCAADSECREGLFCTDEDICDFAGTTEEGQPCFATGECADGLYCDAFGGVCLPAGQAAEGEGCGGTDECSAGLVCQARGLSGVCVEGGTSDVGTECSGTGECLPGLGCANDPRTPEEDTTVCLAGPAGLPTPWPGVECAEDDPEGDFKVYFEVPDGEVTEFYRLPYPNDIRLSEDGTPDLSGHPTPGKGVLDQDIVQTYIDAIESEQQGFGLNQATYFRFSKVPDFGTLDVNQEGQNIFFYNIDPDSPRYGQRRGLRWFASSGATKYICQNRFLVRPLLGSPLAPNTTYAMILGRGIRSNDGDTIVRDGDFDAMLSESRPAGALGDAWDAYQPLRAWLADTEVERPVDASDLVVAAVFTTGNPRLAMRDLSAQAIQNGATASDLTLCEAGTTSPCDDGLEGEAHRRGCFDDELSSDWAEIHGRLSLPVFQEGEAPYLESGGAALATPQRSEDVCMSMTVPTAAMPENGYPLVIYAHGTEGTFRSNVGDVADLANVTIDGTDVPFVTVGWDQVLHGTRANGSDIGANELVYNYANPDAALGNFLQGAAEIHSIVQWAKTFSVDAESSPTGEAITIDPTQIYFYGHSQGGTTGPLALPFDQDVQGAVLSGAGAGLSLAITRKTSPVNSPAALAVVLQEPEIGEGHPVINLLQGYFDPVDPLNFAAPLAASPVEGVTYPHHVFHTNGIGDTFTPPAALNTMAIALRATYINPVPEEIDGISSADAPFSGNVIHDMTPYTVAGRQYTPDGYDGHFVAFRNSTAVQDIINFLGTAYTTGVPEIR